MRKLSTCKTGEYDPQAAYMLCLAAGWAYLEFDRARDVYRDHGYELHRVAVDSISCDVASSADATIVAFAGTNDAEDWLTNLDVAKVDWDGYQLHRGFHQAEAAIAQRLSSRYSSEMGNLWVTGHSMGGALATLHALRFASGFGDEYLSGVYTFGSPRCMDSRASAMCDQLMWSRHYRHTHGNDLVPRVPSRLRFKHCGRHAHINRRRQLLHNPSPLALLIDRVLGFRMDMVRNHFVEKYLYPLAVASECEI